MNLHEQAAEIARLAAKASKGSYTTEAVMDNFFTDICLVDEIPGEGSPQVIATCLCDESDLADVKQATSNARFFAAAPRMAALIAEMDARIREMEADAERYKWLRDNSTTTHELFMVAREDRAGVFRSSNEIDDIIDAARKEQTT